MKRQFLRVYLGIAAVLLLAALATLFVVEREVGKAVDQRLEDSMTPWVNRLRARLRHAETAEERNRTLERAAESAPFAIRLQPLSELPLTEVLRARLAEGEPVLIRVDGSRVVYGQLDDSLALAMGPLPRQMPVPPRGRGPGPPRLDDRPNPRYPYNPGFFGGDQFRGTVLMLGVLLAILMVIGAAVYLLLRPFERRIYALADVARRFGEGRLEVRASAGRADAIAALATAFNQMADRIAGLIAQQRDLMRAVSHELRTPLARLFFLVDDAQSATDPQTRDRYLQRVEGSLQDLNALVEELLTFVRLEGATEDGTTAVVPLDGLYAEAAAVLADLRAGLTTTTDGSGLAVQGVPRLLRRAVLNLATNAAQHAHSRVDLTAHREQDQVCLVVDDDGPGVPEAARERVFEPFFRLDEARSADLGGVGLGLSIVQRVATCHGGSVRIEASPWGGARFVLSLPTPVTPAVPG